MVHIKKKKNFKKKQAIIILKKTKTTLKINESMVFLVLSSRDGIITHVFSLLI